MTWTNKVNWREGMFLQPQHFQQHDRYWTGFVGRRVEALHPYPWGIAHLEIDTPRLALGQIQLNRCRGIFDDGTPFDIPASDGPGPALAVTSEAEGRHVYLTIPQLREGAAEAGRREQADALTRFIVAEDSVRDSNADAGTVADVEVARLRLALALDGAGRDGYASLAIARIRSVRADGAVELDEAFIPPSLDCQAIPRLRGYIDEILGLLRHRGEYLASRVTPAMRSGTSQVGHYLLLQVVNRFEPLCVHLAGLGRLHPIDLFQVALQLAGEVSTFTTELRRPPAFPTYDHRDLEGTLAPVVAVIREELTRVMEEVVIEIPIKSDRFGFRVAIVEDPHLLAQASFVLAARADVPPERLRRDFPPQVTIGTPQEITRLVNSHLPGIGLYALPTAPPQIPYHAGHTYFELDRTSKQWKDLASARAIAFHVAGEPPGLGLTLWAIKS